MNFLARSCKILQFLGLLGKSLGKILTKKFKNIQDSYQEFQEFLHWVMTFKFIRTRINILVYDNLIFKLNQSLVMTLTLNLLTLLLLIIVPDIVNKTLCALLRHTIGSFCVELILTDFVGV